MNIFVQGDSKAKHNFTRGMAMLLAKQLKCDNSKKDLFIILKRGFQSSYAFNGITHYKDDEVVIAIDSSLKEEKFMTTLAHEMVHVKQICKGQLKFEDSITTTWMRKHFVNADHNYIDLPWEYEAFSLQEILIRQIGSCISQV